MSYQARQALARIDLFAGLSDRAMEELVQAGATRTSGPGRRIVEQGSSDAGLQVVLDGTAEVTVNGASRPALQPGDYFGEISMIDGSPRSATITSGPEGLTTFMLSSLAFSPMLDNPEVSRTLMKALCARLRQLEQSPID
jgi:CRP-like cAMP-binding protein